MPMTPMHEIYGHKCYKCSGYATHFYCDRAICCDCRGEGGVVTQAEMHKYYEEHWMCCGVVRHVDQRCSCGEGADD
ncbi:hypothetical protein KAR91_52030 [Candidatus Pacearchaeota archaeon]|nr:hypothetical protein [Candidatus Pacearchaeota archaeon]